MTGHIGTFTFKCKNGPKAALAKDGRRKARASHTRRTLFCSFDCPWKVHVTCFGGIYAQIANQNGV